jgi:hypothetical protein
MQQEDSQAQRAKYTEQLEEIDALLVEDPENTEFLELRQDLLQILSLLPSAPQVENKQELATAPHDSYAWKIGQSCNVISSSSSSCTSVERAEIVSIAADRSIFTVKLQATGVLFSCPANCIKPLAKRHKDSSSIKEYGHLKSSKTTLSKETRIKKKKQLEKFIAKQHDAQQTKKANWQSFQQRLSQLKK